MSEDFDLTPYLAAPNAGAWVGLMLRGALVQEPDLEARYLPFNLPPPTPPHPSMFASRPGRPGYRICGPMLPFRYEGAVHARPLDLWALKHGVLAVCGDREAGFGPMGTDAPAQWFANQSFYYDAFRDIDLTNITPRPAVHGELGRIDDAAFLAEMQIRQAELRAQAPTRFRLVNGVLELTDEPSSMTTLGYDGAATYRFRSQDGSVQELALGTFDMQRELAALRACEAQPGSLGGVGTSPTVQCFDALLRAASGTGYTLRERPTADMLAAVNATFQPQEPEMSFAPFQFSEPAGGFGSDWDLDLPSSGGDVVNSASSSGFFDGLGGFLGDLGRAVLQPEVLAPVAQYIVQRNLPAPATAPVGPATPQPVGAPQAQPRQTQDIITRTLNDWFPGNIFDDGMTADEADARARAMVTGPQAAPPGVIGRSSMVVQQPRGNIQTAIALFRPINGGTGVRLVRRAFVDHPVTGETYIFQNMGKAVAGANELRIAKKIAKQRGLVLKRSGGSCGCARPRRRRRPC